jgi:hypothetical protein
MITNPNYRLFERSTSMRKQTEDEIAEYRQEANEEAYNREQQREWAANQSKHVLDPDREWPEEEEE